MGMNEWLDRAQEDAALMEDFSALCAFGGRLAGSGEDESALAWAMQRLGEIGTDVRRVDVPYEGWRCLQSSLTLVGATETPLRCHPLLRSLSTSAEGLVGDLLDLGEGRAEDFARAGAAVSGKIVLVRHEFPFSSTHMHRRKKYDLAVQQGAVGFLIANPVPGMGLLSGSSGRKNGMPGIPAAYVDHAAGEVLAEACAAGGARVRLCVIGEELPHASAGVAILDLPGGSDDRVVISAHIDGHDLGQSALDNASGVVVALAAARALAPLVSSNTCGLRICFFSAEEWALAGSARYLDDMSEGERGRLKLNINLDTVGGDDTLTALISDFPLLENFVGASASMAGVAVGTWLPLMANSDHANFARHGIPALRLVAGFGRPESLVNRILSADDRPSLVLERELRQALRVTCAMGWTGMTLSAPERDDLAVRTA